LNRISEISQATLRTGLLESTFKSSQLIGEAKQYMWGVSPEPLPQPFEEIAKQIPKGVEYRILSPQPPASLANLEIGLFPTAQQYLSSLKKRLRYVYGFSMGE